MSGTLFIADLKLDESGRSETHCSSSRRLPFSELLFSLVHGMPKALSDQAAIRWRSDRRR